DSSYKYFQGNLYSSMRFFMWSKSSSGYVLALLELMPTNTTPLFLYFSAVCRVTSSLPSTYGQWLQVKNTTRNFASLKFSSEYVFPSVAGRLKPFAFSPGCNVNAIIISIEIISTKY